MEEVFDDIHVYGFMLFIVVEEAHEPPTLVFKCFIPSIKVYNVQ